MDALWLTILGDPVLSKPGQEARYYANNVSVSIRWQDSPIEAETADISESGIGVWTYAALPRFSKVTLIVREGSTSIECMGTVRYSRIDPNMDGAYRAGIQVEFADRLSQAMWHRLVLASNQSPVKAA